MPFEEDELDVPAPKNNLKIKNVNPVNSPLSNREEFEKNSSDSFQKGEDLKRRTYELTKSFKDLLSDKTLKANKGPISESREKEIVDQLVTLGIEINLDEDQEEGMGSIGLVALLMRALIYQRDRINELEFKFLSLDKTLPK